MRNLTLMNPGLRARVEVEGDFRHKINDDSRVEGRLGRRQPGTCTLTRAIGRYGFHVMGCFTERIRNEY